MKVGPKGQVVIPRALRKALKIHPGTKVVFILKGDRIVLKKPKVDSVALIESIAKNGPFVKWIPPHLIKEELAKRT